jgi:hypothetical protein
MTPAAVGVGATSEFYHDTYGRRAAPALITIQPRCDAGNQMDALNKYMVYRRLPRDLSDRVSAFYEVWMFAATKNTAVSVFMRR